MGNIKAIDKDSYAIEIAASGSGSSADPFVTHHKIVNSVLPDGGASLNAQNQQINQISEVLASISDLENQLQNLINISGSTVITNFPQTQAILGNVSVGNFPNIQPVSGTVGINNFPAIQPICDIQTSYVETALTLGVNGAFTGTNRDAQNRNTVRGWVWTNVSGTLYIEQSINNTSWRVTDIISITGSTTQVTDFLFRLLARYYRLRYVNGNVAQSSFEIISTTFGIGL